MSEDEVRAAICNQARFCADSGSALTASVLHALERVIDRTTQTGQDALGWPGDPRGSGDSVPLRLAGGLHALARSGKMPALSRAYATGVGDFDALVAAALRDHDATLRPWLDLPPQTNEVGRSAAIMAGLLVLQTDHPLPIELIELGASGGLNLNLDRFGYRLGGTVAGDAASAVQLAPQWEGRSPPAADVRVIARAGVDQAPVATADPAQRERLLAYVWADQAARVARLEAALAIADAYRPPVERGDAADFAVRMLARPPESGTLRVVYHTIFWSYLPPDKQARITAALDRAGADATADSPLAWLRFELTGEGGVAALDLTSWPQGRTVQLATGHPHGDRISWLANDLTLPQHRSG